MRTYSGIGAEVSHSKQIDDGLCGPSVIYGLIPELVLEDDGSTGPRGRAFDVRILAL